MVGRPSESGFTVMETVIVVCLVGIVSAIAVPMFGNVLAGFRLSGDARSVANAIALAKMRAASNFSRARLYVDLTSDTHHVESWDKGTSTWIAESSDEALKTGVSFGYDIIGAAPPNTQGTIAQAPACLDDAGVAIANTACVMFNSRGVPIDASLAPTALDAVYLTDGSAVYGITVAATGMLRTWHAFPAVTPNWVLN
jgi:Tfp pilus assembly protein PilE